MSNKHPKSRRPSDADLRGGPGTGSRKGPERPEGGIDPNQRGRTNT